jgi:hypothetical protein
VVIPRKFEAATDITAIVTKLIEPNFIINFHFNCLCFLEPLYNPRPMDDPLEIVLYLTSVGVPSSIYDTVRSLRQARATRLGALQKKLPPLHLSLLWLLAVIELSSFPVLGAGTQSIGGYNILTIKGIMFGILTFRVTITLNVVGELYVGRGGAYIFDSVLAEMVRGLEEELEGRMAEIVGVVKVALIVQTHYAMPL